MWITQLRAIGGVVAGLVLLASCAVSPSAPRYWTDVCPHDGAGFTYNTDQGPHEIQLPEDFVPVSVTRCSRVPGTGDRQAREEPAPLNEDLEAAFGLPDTPLPRGVSCNARGLEFGILFVLLVDQEGRALRPNIPLGACDPRPEVLESLNATSFTLRAAFEVDPSSFPT